MSSEFITLFMFGTMMVLLFTGQRVFGVIGFVGSAAALWLWGQGAFEMPFNASFQVLNWYPLITVPFFVFMGYMLSESGMASNLYRLFHVWFGPVRGGLALGTIGLMVLIAALNGLSVAGMAIGATIALPQLLLMAVVFAAYVYIRCLVQPELGPALPAEERAEITWAEKFSLLRAGLLPVAIFAIMMGLFMTGTTSLVESSAVGAALATIAAWLSGNLNRKVFEESTRNTLSISCMFLWIILGALCFSSVYDGLGAVKAVKTLLIDTWDFAPWTILILMLLSFIVMGMFLDDTAMLVIVAPLYIPLVISLGFNPIWFGILYTITCQIAYITPPFGYNLFLMRAMAPPEITLVDIYRSIIPFFGLMVLSLIIIMIFPQIALWLPSLYSGR